ncbi:quinate 5-dehydrogenase [Orenia metallireducens]|uniref:Quinate 5-dehydrogenase n=1 Tax=Orenia metallireducens TaxID=1413210 RepID=A0A1C0AD42_9FIRM|nr:quinate 5-dehydrogenase [Orenia metallireducens]OCL28568.1 quinate 5-dehydrogenase [Orenia metallireducens]
MKRVVSISLGSSARDHRVQREILGEQFIIERIGTDGDMDKAIKMFNNLDGKVDAFGLGGIDLYLYAGKKRYLLRDAKKIIKNINKTPIVDGSGLKNTLERRAIKQVNKKINLKDKRILMVCALDRFGMAEALKDTGAKLLIGDLIFGLGIPIPLKSLGTLHNIAQFIMPIVSKLPFKLLYPTGSRQEEIRDKYSKYYEWADIIAGDFHYIKRYLPANLGERIIITNTVTPSDIELLKERGLSKLITTTPEFRGRSFGTNVMEAILVTLLDKPLDEIRVSDYLNILREIDFEPRVEEFNQGYLIR